MYIVITGATGFVGQQVVKRLIKNGHVLLLVGRKKERLSECFPDFDTCCYQELANKARGYDLLINLATQNNNSSASYEEFYMANVSLVDHIAGVCEDVGIKCLLYVSSFHCLNERDKSHYAATKRLGAAKIANLLNVNTCTLFLPIVYGDFWGGKLKFLNRLPKVFSNVIFDVLASLKPTVHVDQIVDIIENRKYDTQKTIFISKSQQDNFTYRCISRFLDLMFASIVSLFFCWLLIAVWFAIKVDSPGPALFKQTRVGKKGKLFVCYKFRTMQANTAEVATHQVSPAALTGLGSFLRKTKIDELPQVLNIFKNDLSLIGPRPCLPSQKRLIRIRNEHSIFDIKPGITGWAQVNNIDMSCEEKLKNWDLEYLCQQSLVFDSSIFIKTFFGSGLGDRIKRPV